MCLYLIHPYLTNLLSAHRHVLFTSPKVGDIVQLLLDQNEKVGKSDEELLVEATALVKKAFAEVLSLEEDAVKDETDFFEVGGSELLLLCFLCRLFGVHPDKSIQCYPFCPLFICNIQARCRSGF